jgi:hypothetical protein
MASRIGEAIALLVVVLWAGCSRNLVEDQVVPRDAGPVQSMPTADAGSPDGGAAPDAGAPVDAGVDAGPIILCEPGAIPDECAVLGLVCVVRDGATKGTCHLPSEYGPCLHSVGCGADNLVCQDFVGSSGTISLCVTFCDDTRDCANVQDECGEVQGHQICRTVWCGPGSAALNGGVQNGTDFYGSCTMLPGNRPGTCIPTDRVGSVGQCYETGSVAMNELCSPTRIDGGSEGLCGPALNCIAFGNPDKPDSIRAMCVSLCDNTGLGPFVNCPQGDFCFAHEADLFGFCLQDCVPGPVNTCPPKLDCLPFPFNGIRSAECLPKDAGG